MASETIITRDSVTTANVHANALNVQGNTQANTVNAVHVAAQTMSADNMNSTNLALTGNLTANYLSSAGVHATGADLELKLPGTEGHRRALVHDWTHNGLVVNYGAGPGAGALGDYSFTALGGGSVVPWLHEVQSLGRPERRWLDAHIQWVNTEHVMRGNGRLYLSGSVGPENGVQVAGPLILQQQTDDDEHKIVSQDAQTYLYAHANSAIHAACLGVFSQTEPSGFRPLYIGSVANSADATGSMVAVGYGFGMALPADTQLAVNGGVHATAYNSFTGSHPTPSSPLSRDADSVGLLAETSGVLTPLDGEGSLLTVHDARPQVQLVETKGSSCNKGTADEAGVLGAQPKLTPQCGIPKGLIP